MLKISNWFLGSKYKKLEQEFVSARQNYESNLSYLQSEIKDLQGRLTKRLPDPKPAVNVNLAEPIPADGEARKGYVARVAGFHKDILKPKILSMLSETHRDMEKVDNPPAWDALLKACCNILWLFDDWGEQMQNEHVANQSGNGTEEDEGLTGADREEINKALNKK